MAKNMARVVNGVVVNVDWCSDDALETETLKNTFDRPVGIGDEYHNGKWYRNGVEILTPLEKKCELVQSKLAAFYADKRLSEEEYNELTALVQSVHVGNGSAEQ